MSISSYSRARELYGEGELEKVMAFCAHNGFVYADKEVFLCAYPTSSSLVNNDFKKDVDKPDTWYVYVASGNLKRAFQVIKPLEFICYRRFDEKFRLIRFERFRRLLIWGTRG